MDREQTEGNLQLIKVYRFVTSLRSGEM